MLSEINIKQVDFPINQYYKKTHVKKQIVLHHTVSPVGVNGDLSWWMQTASRIATFGIVDHFGVLHQCFNSTYWAHHLGVKKTVFNKYNLTPKNTELNQKSIGIEIDSAGGLTKRNGKWITSFGTTIKDENVYIYPKGFRGFYGYEKYTNEQLDTVSKVIKYWKANIHCDVNYEYNDDIWDVTTRALKGEPGIFTHVSYRKDKSDCHPQPQLIEMLKNI